MLMGQAKYKKLKSKLRLAEPNIILSPSLLQIFLILCIAVLQYFIFLYRSLLQ